MEIFFLENIFGGNIFWQKYFQQKYFQKNIFRVNIFSKNIFFLPLPHLTALPTTPLLSSSSVILKLSVTNEGLTDRTEHTMIVPFIVLDCKSSRKVPAAALNLYDSTESCPVSPQLYDPRVAEAGKVAPYISPDRDISG